jgi:hypothetical protein
MIHHISIPAREPRRVAEVLAEIMGGRAYPFTGPLPGAYMAVSGDAHGTMIEVYPDDVVMEPGEGDRQVAFTPGKPVYQNGPLHALLSVPLSGEQIQAIGDREGWRTRYFGRGPAGKPAAFHLYEFWVENRILLEVAPIDLVEEYENVMQFERLEAIFRGRGVELAR